MRDVDDGAAALGAQLVEDAKEMFGILLAERGSGLVKNQYFRIGSDCLGDFYKLLFRHGKTAGECVRADACTNPLQGFRRVLAFASPVDFSPEIKAVLGHADVFSDCE